MRFGRTWVVNSSRKVILRVLIAATDASDFGLVSTSAVGPRLSIFHLNIVLLGVLIVVFLILEPLGLYRIWIRLRSYWKAWPLSYQRPCGTDWKTGGDAD